MGHHALEAPCSASLMDCFVAFHCNISVPIGTKFPIDFIQSTFGELRCSNKSSVASLTCMSSTGRLWLCPRLYSLWYPGWWIICYLAFSSITGEQKERGWKQELSDFIGHSQIYQGRMYNPFLSHMAKPGNMMGNCYPFPERDRSILEQFYRLDG